MDNNQQRIWSSVNRQHGLYLLVQGWFNCNTLCVLLVQHINTSRKTNGNLIIIIMSILEIITILENKIKSLEKLKNSAQETGELSDVIRLQTEIDETTMTLNKIKETL
jgi:D-alanyl-lipoteichoic acid acyltransferase DltB (MBOAT superfamily)